MTDKISFKVINPKGKEAWADDYDISEVVEIYINDTELVDILYEIERQYISEEGHPNLAGAYGHNTPKELVDNLLEASADCHEDGVELLCCSDCGFSGCWSILVYIKYDTDYVHWYKFEHNHRNWKYNISYKFDRIEYEKALKELRDSEHLQRK